MTRFRCATALLVAVFFIEGVLPTWQLPFNKTFPLLSVKLIVGKADKEGRQLQNGGYVICNQKCSGDDNDWLSWFDDSSDDCKIECKLNYIGGSQPSNVQIVYVSSQLTNQEYKTNETKPLKINPKNASQMGKPEMTSFILKNIGEFESDEDF